MLLAECFSDQVLTLFLDATNHLMQVIIMYAVL